MEIGVIENSLEEVTYGGGIVTETKGVAFLVLLSITIFSTLPSALKDFSFSTGGSSTFIIKVLLSL